LLHLLNWSGWKSRSTSESFHQLVAGEGQVLVDDLLVAPVKKTTVRRDVPPQNIGAQGAMVADEPEVKSPRCPVVRVVMKDPDGPAIGPRAEYSPISAPS